MNCFWNSELEPETSTPKNYDWYGPSEARRFSREDVERWVDEAGMDVFFFLSKKLPTLADLCTKSKEYVNPNHHR